MEGLRGIITLWNKSAFKSMDGRTSDVLSASLPTSVSLRSGACVEHSSTEGIQPEPRGHQCWRKMISCIA